MTDGIGKVITISIMSLWPISQIFNIFYYFILIISFGEVLH